MKDIEEMIELENIVTHHQECLTRLIAYSVRGMLNPLDFTFELAKMQNQAFKRCLSHLSESEKKELIDKYIKL